MDSILIQRALDRRKSEQAAELRAIAAQFESDDPCLQWNAARRARAWATRALNARWRGKFKVVV